MFVLCSVLPLFVLCFGETKTAFLYYICKQTTTPSVLTIGSLPIQLSSLTTKTHTHTLTYLHAHIQAAIKRFSWFFIVLFYQCFFSIIFWLKIDKYRPSFSSKKQWKTKVTAKVTTKSKYKKTTNKQHFQKGDNEKTQKLKLKVRCENTHTHTTAKTGFVHNTHTHTHSC